MEDRYVAPSVETIRAHGLEPFVRRALGLIHAVHELEWGWRVNGYAVHWDGVGFRCKCMNWELHGGSQGGYCKHSLAVCLRAESYRNRIIAALEEEVAICGY